MIETLWQDVRLAVRGLMRSRWIGVIAAGSLALGIAANATVFSLVQAVEFPRLPYTQNEGSALREDRGGDLIKGHAPLLSNDAYRKCSTSNGRSGSF